jgi:RNA polymerase sigma factor (sigma-70 family)
MGDEDTAMLGFVASRYPHLRRSAYLMCGDWGAAAQVVQRTLARLVADPRRGEIQDLDRVAYAELMAAFPRRRSRREHVFVAPVGTRSERMHDHTPTILLLDALQKLSPRCRAVVVMRHWDGMQFAEIARVLGITQQRAGTYEQAGCRALERLLGDLVAR